MTEAILTRDTACLSPFDFTPFLAAGLPAAGRRNGTDFPNTISSAATMTPSELPLDDLIAAATAVLRARAARSRTTGSKAVRSAIGALREFLVDKLSRDAGIACAADEILVTSGSLQAIDLVNALLLERGDTVLVEQVTYFGSLNRLTGSA